jgi:NAD-dependent dihydropyrimidine dehydrogenase PreA subunit
MISGQIRENLCESASKFFILCGSCVDTCPKQVIRYAFSRGK